MIHAVAYSPNQSLLHRLFYSIHQKAYSTRALMILLSLASKGNLRILLADDDEDDRDIFINVLTEVSDSVHITVARNGQDALDTLSTTNELPDIIFLDLNMPVMGGADCLRMLKANPRLKDIPVFIYSTSSNHEHVEETFTGGASLYIPKPESYTGLRNMAKAVLALNLSDCIKPRRENFLLKVNN